MDLDTAVARAEELLGKCRSCERALAKAEDMRGKVRPAAFARVEQDYRARLADAKRDFEAHKHIAVTRLDETRRQLATQLAHGQKVEEERDELVLRTHLGELTDAAPRIAALDAELAAVRQRVDAMEASSRAAVTRLGLDSSIQDLVASLGPAPNDVPAPVEFGRPAAPPASGADATEIFAGGALHLPTGQTFRLGFGRLVVGGADDSDIALRHPSVRPRHATITFTGGKHIVAAIDGALRVNGWACQEAELADGDRIEFGEVGTVFRTGIQHALPFAAPMVSGGASPTVLTTRSQVEMAIAERTGGKQDTFILQRPLLVIRESGRTRSVRLDLGQAKIGSAPDDDIVLDSLKPHHAAIRFEHDGFVALAGAGPIHVNARAATRAQLADGDVIRLGGVEIQFCESGFNRD